MTLTKVDYNMYEGAGYRSVSEMVASGTLTVGDFVLTQGYYTPGDGGEGVYKIVAGNLGDGFLDHNAGIVTCVLQHKNDMYIKQAGTITDGTTDDSQRIAAAFKAVAAVNGKLTFEPNGKYGVDGLLGKHDCERIEVDGQGATLMVTGLTKTQLEAEGDAARGWWYGSQCLHLNASEGLALRNLHWDAQDTFLYQTMRLDGKAYVRNVSIKNIRYPNQTFSNQWRTSNEGAFITERGVGSDIRDVHVTDAFYQDFYDVLTKPNARGEFQARAFAINGNNTNSVSSYTNIRLDRISMGIIIDDGGYLTFENCLIRNARANAVYELGALSVKYLGCSFINCDDQGVSTYGSDVTFQGCTFYNVANRCIALRNSAKTRILIDGNTFRHQISPNCPNMMPIGRPDAKETKHNIKDMIISNNTFNIEVLNYYFADVGPVESTLNVNGNTFRYDEANTNTPVAIWWESTTTGVTNETARPVISGNVFYSTDNETMRLGLATDRECLIIGNSFRNKVDDSSSPAFAFPSSATVGVESNGDRSRSVSGANADTLPMGQFHIKGVGEVDTSSKPKDQTGSLVTYEAETNIFSPYKTSTIGASGFIMDNMNNEQPSSNYVIMSPHPTTRLLRRVAHVDRNGAVVSDMIPSDGGGMVVRSPNGNYWKITANNSGVLSATAYTAPH